MPSQRNYISDVQKRLLHPIPTYSTIYRRGVQPVHKLHNTRKFTRAARERADNNRDGPWPGKNILDARELLLFRPNTWLLLLLQSVQIADRERVFTAATRWGITACQKRKVPSFQAHELNKITCSKRNYFLLVKKLKFTLEHAMKAQMGSTGIDLLSLTLALGGVQIKNKMGSTCGTYGTGEGHTGFWWGDLGEKHHLEHLGVKGMILKLIFKKCDGGAWTGLMWLRKGTGGGLLWTQ